MGKVVKFKKFISPDREYKMAIVLARDSLNKVVNWAYAAKFHNFDLEKLIDAFLVLQDRIREEIDSVEPKKGA